jgi:hypothetical protein
MKLTGGCSCGAVRYSIDESPIRSFQCQCRDCQKDTGGGHSSVMVFTRSAVHVDGEVKEILREANSGKAKRKGFCGECGSPIYNKPETQPDLIGVYVGSLDDASTFQPSIVLFTSRGYAWDHVDPDIPHLAEWYGEQRSG